MEKRICTVLSVLLLQVTICTQAQNYDTYKLKDYQTPDIRRSSLDVKLNSQGGFTTNEYNDKNRFELQGEANLDFKHYLNTRSFIGEQQATIALSGINSREYPDSESKNNNLLLLPHMQIHPDFIPRINVSGELVAMLHSLMKK